MKNRIAFIIPYFGKFNNYFDLWLMSCGYNSDIADFLIFTDIVYDGILPDNVRLIHMTFDDLVNIIQQKYDFDVYLKEPYQLCDFKVAYGDIFEDYIINYSHFAYGDNDVIWGCWTDMLPENWHEYERIGYLGHLSIFRNTSKMRTLYKFRNAYKLAFSTEGNTFFDEWTFNKIAQKYGVKEYRDILIAECKPRKKKILLNTALDKMSGVFLFNSGHLFQAYREGKDVKLKEYLYIHFLKRKMIKKGGGMQSQVYIYENILNMDEVDVAQLLRNQTRSKINWKYWVKFLNPFQLLHSIYHKIDWRLRLLPIIHQMDNLVLKND